MPLILTARAGEAQRGAQDPASGGRKSEGPAWPGLLKNGAP